VYTRPKRKWTTLNKFNEGLYVWGCVLSARKKKKTNTYQNDSIKWT
jgi:hypothetical protein